MQKFNDALAEAMGEVVRNVFGDETAGNILKYFDDSSSKNLGERLRIFEDALQRILGAGSIIIEDLILEALHSKFGLQPDPEKGCGFAECIVELRARLEGNQKVRDHRGRLRKAVESILIRR